MPYATQRFVQLGGLFNSAVCVQLDRLRYAVAIQMDYDSATERLEFATIAVKLDVELTVFNKRRLQRVEHTVLIVV